MNEKSDYYTPALAVTTPPTLTGNVDDVARVVVVVVDDDDNVCCDARHCLSLSDWKTVAPNTMSSQFMWFTLSMFCMFV